MMFQKSFCMFKTTIIVVFFFQMSIFFIKCVPFFLKIEKDINIEDDFFKAFENW
jgi:hypothetical protein